MRFAFTILFTVVAATIAGAHKLPSAPEPTVTLPPSPCSLLGDPCTNEGTLSCCQDQNLFCNALVAGQTGVSFVPAFVEFSLIDRCS